MFRIQNNGLLYGLDVVYIQKWSYNELNFILQLKLEQV